MLGELLLSQECTRSPDRSRAVDAGSDFPICRLSEVRNTKMRTNVYASFNDTRMAKDAVGALLDHGIKTEDITLILPISADSDPEVEKERAEAAMKGAEHGLTTTSQDDAAVGATKGAFMGFGIGSLAALASIMIPGVGLIVGGGALAIALAGAAGATVAGTVAGGVFGYLKDQGVPESESQRFSNVYEQGGAILSVSAPSGTIEAGEIEIILTKYGLANTEIWMHDPAMQPVTASTVGS